MEINKKTGKIFWGVKPGDKCPYCHGFVVEKTGKFGQFLSCSEFPYCAFSERPKVKLSD